MTPAITLARFALIEARRSGLPWLVVASTVVGVGLAGFLSQVAITESLQLQAAISAAFLRACAVFLIAIHVTTSMVRESGDKGLELVLSMPLTRSEYYLGKLLGFACCGALMSLCFAAPLLLWCAPAAVGLWWLSLLAETVLVAAASLFFVMTLRQIVPAISASAGLYLLGRAIAAIQAIASGPLAGESPVQKFARWSVDAVALLLPRLDAATRSEWLLYAMPGAGEYSKVLLALLLYALLAACAGLFDFHRRNL